MSQVMVCVKCGLAMPLIGELAGRRMSCPQCGCGFVMPGNPPISESVSWPPPLRDIAANQAPVVRRSIPRNKLSGPTIAFQIGVFVILAAVFVGFLYFFANSESGILVPQQKVTYSNYLRVSTGMSKAQVCEILGDDFELIAQSELGEEEPFHVKTEMLEWHAGFGNCNVTFQNDKMVGKAEIGLK